MTDASITYFPVGNGDTTLIRLADETDILIDSNIRASDSDEQHYDVHEHLLQHVNRNDDDTPFINAFILTHPDQDHCRGFESAFYTGPPSEYSEEDEKNGTIIINELWFSPRVFSDLEDELCDDAEAFLAEAERRMKLYKSEDDRCNDPGNRLRIIGSTDSEDLEGLEDIVYIPGDVADEIDGKRKHDFSFFVHAPFKADTDSEDGERNNTSVVLQARFDVDDEVSACLAFFGGDADYRVWGHILNKSDDDTLSWDLLLAPHHCSWTFFNDHGESEPHPDSLELLKRHRDGACIIASCKPIADDDDNPPSYEARQEYIAVVGEEQFLVTSEAPSEDAPEPIVFVMTANGPCPEDSSSTANTVAGVAAVNQVARSKPTFG